MIRLSKYASSNSIMAELIIFQFKNLLENVSYCFFSVHFCCSNLLSLQRMEASVENRRFYVFVEAKRGVAANDILQYLQDVLGNAAP